MTSPPSQPDAISLLCELARVDRCLNDAGKRVAEILDAYEPGDRRAAAFLTAGEALLHARGELSDVADGFGGQIVALDAELLMSAAACRATAAAVDRGYAALCAIPALERTPIGNEAQLLALLALDGCRAAARTRQARQALAAIA